jgi:hypothetical protein
MKSPPPGWWGLNELPKYHEASLYFQVTIWVTIGSNTNLRLTLIYLFSVLCKDYTDFHDWYQRPILLVLQSPGQLERVSYDTLKGSFPTLLKYVIGRWTCTKTTSFASRKIKCKSEHGTRGTWKAYFSYLHYPLSWSNGFCDEAVKRGSLAGNVKDHGKEMWL